MKLDARTKVEKINENLIVIIDTLTGQQVTIARETAAELLPAVQYFFPELFVDIAPTTTEIPA
jgi:hypothetical protein